MAHVEGCCGPPLQNPHVRSTAQAARVCPFSRFGTCQECIRLEIDGHTAPLTHRGRYAKDKAVTGEAWAKLCGQAAGVAQPQKRLRLWALARALVLPVTHSMRCSYGWSV